MKVRYGKNALCLLLMGVIFISGCGKREEVTGGEELGLDTIAAEIEEPEGQENQETKIETSSNQGSKADIEMPAETDYEQIYGKVLEEFYALIASDGDGSVTVEGEGGVGEAIRSNREDDNFSVVGYAIEDFSGDGIPELVIGDAVYRNKIYTMFTCTDGEPRCILESYHRSRYSWMGGNEFFYEGSGGAIYTIFAHYTLSPDGRTFLCQEYYFSHETDETFEEIGFYHNTFGEMELGASTRLSSEDEFRQLGEELSGKIQQIELIPFSEYKS
ncbi:MAG: hypothetical protein IJC59_04960 [Lachnospiraceae bacterium]|nr:hypothetical protein [Lachnospiraceae bacterium]